MHFVLIKFVNCRKTAGIKHGVPISVGAKQEVSQQRPTELRLCRGPEGYDKSIIMILHLKAPLRLFPDFG